MNKYKLSLPLILLLVFLGGITIELFMAQIDRNVSKPPGKMVSVNGIQMHLYCTGGTDSNRPTVILDSGAGDNWQSWKKVQPEVSRFARVCSYDRVGLGYSKSSFKSGSNEFSAEQLAKLLQKANIKPPYILVGHSLGAFNVEIFADNHKDEVAGLVLVDPSLEQMETIKSSLMMRVSDKVLYAIAKLSFATSIARILYMVDPNILVPYTTADSQSRAGFLSMKVILSAEREVGRLDYDRIRNINNFGNIPLTVLTSTETSDASPKWIEWSKELAKKSKRNQQLTLKSSHYIQIDEPQQVIDSIEQMVTQ